MLSAEAVLQKYIDIAFADISDFIRFESIESTVEEIERKFDDDGKLEKEITELSHTRTLHFI